MMRKVDAAECVNLLMTLYVEDMLGEDEFVKQRDQTRAAMLRHMSNTNPGYDSTETYGRSNDSEPLPYIEPTAQTDDGYIGLLPPLS
jgi:hypothetical protein